MTTTETTPIEALDFAAEDIPCVICKQHANWSVFSNCCNEFQSFVCDEHRKFVEDYLAQVDAVGITPVCLMCPGPWVGASFRPIKED